MSKEPVLSRQRLAIATRAVLVLGAILLAPGLARAEGDIARFFVEACPDSRRAGPHLPIPIAHRLDSEKIALGWRLFHDPALSRDGSVSCASCHGIAQGGDDGRAVSIGVEDRSGQRNAPTVLNSAFLFRLFWDGRAEDLESQIDGPLHNPDEMDSSWPIVIERLGRDADFMRKYRARYGEPLRVEALKDALATYERSLITPNSAFDRHLCGEDALSSSARDGYRLFLDLGCASCHQGRNLGGNLFQTFGIFETPPMLDDPGADRGRHEVTGRDEDRFVFRVPSLRNVSLTAPYFHDGSVVDLAAAVRVMAASQLGRSLSDDQVAKLVAFLESLTGDLPEDPE
jgi:cytochrome c peroxidase